MLLALGVAALVAVEGSGQGAATRMVPSPPNPEWMEVGDTDGGRGFIDKRSVSLANGLVNYVGRILINRPADYGGAIEIVHRGEINCAAHTYRTLAYDTLGPNGAVLYSRTTPDEPRTIGANSPNDDLYKQYCR